jgi:hypothetical protein
MPGLVSVTAMFFELIQFVGILVLCETPVAMDAGPPGAAMADLRARGANAGAGVLTTVDLPEQTVFATWSAPPADSSDEDDEDVDDDELQVAAELRKLTPEEINRIRYMELRAMRLRTSRPDRVSVRISRETIEEFLVEMEGDSRFVGKRNRQAFLKQTATQKLHVIAQLKGSAFADKVEIQTDPEVFVEFRRNVMPYVLRGCATNGCHGQANEDAVGFRLFKDPKKTAPTTYANFVILSDLAVGAGRVLDRAQPQDSLLLTYMLPRSEVKVEQRHPGDVELKPIFQSRKTARFKRIEKWIGSLRPRLTLDSNEYGVRLVPLRAAPEDGDDSQDGEEKPSPD